MRLARPTLVFDGDCGICRRWVDYWRALTGDRIDYRPYQDAAGDFPAIPLQRFQAAMILIEPDGQTYAGAAAAFRLLSYAPARGGWWWAYAHVPGFAPVSEAAYTFLSQRRGLLGLSHALLWGTPLEPERYDPRELACSCAGSGSSISPPSSRSPCRCWASSAPTASCRCPSISPPRGPAWAHRPIGSCRRCSGSMPSDAALLAAAWAGVALGRCSSLGLLVRPALIALYVLYLSYIYAGQIFFNFQWDMLLIETGFLAIFLTGGSRIVVWLYRLLLFRFVFLSGVVKYVSGDPTWHELTALDYHFWTQPLPSPLAWYAGHLPHWPLAAMTAGTLIVELFVAFLIFLPRRPRAVGACIILAFQLGIIATGSYNFFNLLTMLLCLFLFDDAGCAGSFPARSRPAPICAHPGPGRRRRRWQRPLPSSPCRRFQPDVGAAHGPQPTRCRRAAGGRGAAAIVNPYGVVRGHDDDAAGDRLRGLRRRQGVARIRAALHAGPRHAPAHLEHPAPAAARLAIVVRRLRGPRAQPLDRAAGARALAAATSG